MLYSIESPESEPSSIAEVERDTESTLTNDSSFRYSDTCTNSKALRILEPKLVGHANEIETIFKAYERVFRSGISETLFVHGPAGIGKTSLVETLRDKVVDSGGWYVTGKFYQIRKQDLYGPIVSIFDDLCDLIAQSENMEEIRTALIESLGEDLKIFARHVSGILNLTGNAACAIEDSYDKEWKIRQAFIRLKRQCRSFLNAVASITYPIAIFLDDIQFADEESLEIFRYLMESVTKNVLFIGAYRDNENGTQKFLTRKDKNSLAGKRQVTHIKVENLNYEELNEMISSITNTEPELTKSLTGICHRKTMGNPCYVIQYLKLLESSRLLVFCPISVQWEWDEAKVQSETNITSNILEIITVRAKSAQANVREVLKLAALLGYMFEAKLLFIIAECQISKKPDSLLSNPKYSENEDYLHSLLLRAEEGGYLEKGMEGFYKWTHDCLMHTFLSMIPENERTNIHTEIGESIMANIPQLNDRQTLLVVEHLNEGIPLIGHTEKKLRLSEMNLEAGKISCSKAAFANGLQYFDNGIALLPKNAWSSNYALTLKLFTNAAKAALNSRNVEKTRHMIQAVLENGKTLMDKISAYSTNINLQRSLGLYEESIDSAVFVSKQLGVKIPRKPTVIDVIYELAVTRRVMKNQPDATILSLPRMDEKRTVSMLILSGITRDVYMRSPELLAIISLRMLRLSVRHGICEYSPQGFCMYGLILMRTKKYSEARRIGKLSILLAEKLQTSRASVYSVYTSIIHLTSPIVEMKDNLLQIYHSGMSAGEISFAFNAGCNAGWMMLHCCSDLDETIRHLRYVHDQMVEFDELSGLSYLRPVLQSALNLAGESDDPVILKGDIHSEDFTLPGAMKKPGAILSCGLSFQQACLFESWYLADHYMELLCNEKLYKKNSDCHFGYSFLKLFIAINHLEQYKSSGRKKHFILWEKNKKEIKWYTEKGFIIYNPMLKLLDAEEMATKDNKEITEAAFNDAISAMANAGYVMLEAFSSERAGDAMYKYFGDQEAASTFFLYAKQKYKEWKSWALLDRIKIKYDKFLSHAEIKLPRSIPCNPCCPDSIST